MWSWSLSYKSELRSQLLQIHQVTASDASKELAHWLFVVGDTIITGVS